MLPFSHQTANRQPAHTVPPNSPILPSPTTSSVAVVQSSTIAPPTQTPMKYPKSLTPFSSTNLYLRWFAKNACGVLGGIYTSQHQLDAITENLIDTHDIYIAINPSLQFRGVKHNDASVPFVTTLLIDIDPLDSLNPPLMPHDEMLSHVKFLLESLLKFIPDYLFLYTGRGYQVWLRINNHAVPTDSDKRLWRLCVSRFLIQLSSIFPVYTGFRIDPSCTDLSRVGRLADTINHKTHRHVLGFLPSGFHAAIDGSAFVRLYQPPPGQVESLSAIKHLNQPWWKAFSDLTVTAQRFLTEGAPSGARNSTAYATACSLLELGVSHDEMKSAIFHGSSLCCPTLSKSEISRIIQNAINHMDK